MDREDAANFGLTVNDFKATGFAAASHGKLTIEVRVELAVPAENCRTYSDRYVWVWKQVSSILAGLNGSGTDDGALMLHSINMPLKPGEIDPDENHGRVEWGCILSLVLDFI